MPERGFTSWGAGVVIRAISLSKSPFSICVLFVRYGGNEVCFIALLVDIFLQRLLFYSGNMRTFGGRKDIRENIFIEGDTSVRLKRCGLKGIAFLYQTSLRQSELRLSFS